MKPEHSLPFQNNPQSPHSHRHQPLQSPEMVRLWRISALFFFFLFLLTSHSSSDNSDLFQQWRQQQGKSYSTDEEKSYTLSLNAFADLTHHEFKLARLCGLSVSASSGDLIRLNPGSSLIESSYDLPNSVDWREKGAVTNVKDQGSCGAWWSFSTTGAMEGINKIVTGSLISLSEQELVDCDRSFNSACNGGLMDYAYEFVIKNKGIDTEDDYPYKGKETSCNIIKKKRNIVTIDGYTDVPENNEDQLLKVVANQPVSVGICDSERAFQLYSKITTLENTRLAGVIDLIKEAIQGQYHPQGLPENLLNPAPPRSSTNTHRHHSRSSVSASEFTTTNRIF